LCRGLLALYGSTLNGRLLVSVPKGVVTWTLPVVAPAGTVALIAVPIELTEKVAGVPLKVTLAVPVSLFPGVVTVEPALPEVGVVSTKGPRPADSRNTVPQPVAQLPLPPPYSAEKWSSPTTRPRFGRWN